jgi:EAL domain-containing protein (putative c-di-GMP-specific phosphodiesterase class I)
MLEIGTNGDAAAFLRALISMGQTLKKRVIAEGIETRGQLDFLATERCNEGQGYYFSPPVAAKHFAQLPYMEQVPS